MPTNNESYRDELLKVSTHVLESHLTHAVYLSDERHAVVRAVEIAQALIDQVDGVCDLEDDE
jgi:hypothetical protein